MTDATNTPNTPATAATEESKRTRTQAFTREFSDFAGPLVLTPTDEVKKLGVDVLKYDAAAIPGFSSMPKGARVILCRAIADQLTQVFAATLRGTKEDGPGTAEQAVDEMRDCFTSIVEGSFTYGRTGTGAGRVQGVALTAALMVAVQYGLADRAAAMAHAHYEAIKTRLASMLEQAEKLDEQAAAIVVPELAKDASKEAKEAHATEHGENIKARAALEAQATALRSAYQQVARTPAVTAKRLEWYPPKKKEEEKPALTLNALFADLGPAPV